MKKSYPCPLLSNAYLAVPVPAAVPVAVPVSAPEAEAAGA